MARKLLAGAAIADNWTGLAGALEGVLVFRGESTDRARVMGVSGHAFRLAIHAGADGMAGPESAVHFDFERALPLYANLGYGVERVAARLSEAVFAKRRQEVIRRVKRAIDRGRPAIVNGLHLPEFGLVKGYDEAAQTWYVSTAVSSQYGETLPLAQWPAPGGLQRVEALILGDRHRVVRDQPLRDALAFAVDYAERGDPNGPAATEHGFAAYEYWLSSYEQPGGLDAFGNARNIQVVLAARRDAAAFLRASALDGGSDFAMALNQAAAAYEAEALALSRLATLFPYPNGGNVESAGALVAGAVSLRQAFGHEREAVANLHAAIAHQGQ